MKKVFSVILSVLYFSLSSGASVGVHYCAGEIESIKINKETISCCCGSSEMSDSCCNDHQFVLDLDTDEEITINSNLNLKNIVLYIFSNSNIQLFREIKIVENNFINYRIPHPKIEPIWLHNCSLTFYG